MGQYENYVGVFDSGVGGLSVLQELVRQLPYENFYYFGDSFHAPYGEKPLRLIRKYSLAIADHMVEEGCKSIVIACNTATSAAASKIRAKYDAEIPILGMEPALKPAAEKEHHGRVLVMATPATLKLEKYQKLSHRLEGEAEFIPVMCRGLAGRIEKGNLDAPDLLDLLRSLIGDYAGKVDGIVLGCTHYPFIKKQIRTIMGDVPLFDGGAGTARQLRRRLVQHNILAPEDESAGAVHGKVVLDSSLKTPETRKIYETLYHTPIE